MKIKTGQEEKQLKKMTIDANEIKNFIEGV